MIWVFNNRILINKVPVELVNNQLEILVIKAIDQTNELIKLRAQRAI